MTPAINILKQRKVSHSIHQYSHDESAESYGLEAAVKMQLPPERVFKTLVVSLDGKELAVAVIPVSSMLNMKALAQVSGAKKATMADKLAVQRATGYVLGGVSPLGQKKSLKTVIDSSANTFPTLYVSAGRRGLEVELSPTDLADLTGALVEEICE